MTLITSNESQIDSEAARSQTEKTLDQSFLWGTRILALAVAAVLVWIAVQVAINSIPAIREFGLQFLTKSAWNPVEDTYGVLPMIYGTLLSSLIALLLAVPIGLASAIILSENFLPLSIRTTLTFLGEHPLLAERLK
ncbi:hypothetical protein H6G97_13530 [Nostoc flagelliforme FACHB-838]|uniref:Phosphate ABC transporter permease subunit PstC n=1 Tax=Nostoc flagelliforme FACHB-838 TaxID=2692904 RepID=A0ABR8DM39_9NOSO|nr:hypothetical protein [Nostoc flagelliforme FACHB-838]